MLEGFFLTESLTGGQGKEAPCVYTQGFATFAVYSEEGMILKSNSISYLHSSLLSFALFTVECVLKPKSGIKSKSLKAPHGLLFLWF